MNKERKITVLDEEIKDILTKLEKSIYCLKDVDLRDKSFSAYDRVRAIVQTFPCILENKLKFVRLCYILQREFRIEMDLCRHFEIQSGEYKTLCHANKSQKEVSLEKNGITDQYCCPINHGNCSFKKEQKKNGNRYFQKIYLLTARGMLLED